MITTLHKPLEKAQRFRYAIPAFNVTNLETIIAVIEAAALTKSPVIIQTSESAIRYAGHQAIHSLIENVAHERGRAIPIITHLDHGKHWHIVKASIDVGYRSVHRDASDMPFEKNIHETRQAVVAGHKRGITVQGELGSLLGLEGMIKNNFRRQAIVASMTDPDEADTFVAKTRVDTLAVAIGTAHGIFVGKEKIDMVRLRAIYDRIRIPLVLHGGSGTSRADVRKAIAHGIRIINIDTELRHAFMSGMRAAMKNDRSPHAGIDIRQPLTAAYLTMRKEAITIIKLFGSANCA